MACKENHYRLLQDEDEYSEPDHGVDQRARLQSLLHKRPASLSLALLALSVILNAVLFFSRHTPLVAVSHQDQSKYGPLLDTSILSSSF